MLLSLRSSPLPSPLIYLFEIIFLNVDYNLGQQVIQSHNIVLNGVGQFRSELFEIHVVYREGEVSFTVRSRKQGDEL